MIRIVTLLGIAVITAFALWKSVLIADNATTPITPPALRAFSPDNQPSSSDTDQSEFVTVPFPQFVHAVEKPIFLSSRKFVTSSKPVEIPKPVAKPNGLDPKNISIHGIVMFGDQRKALLKIENNKQKWFRSGQLVGDWQITAIGENILSLKRHDEQIQIRLYQND